MKKLFIILFFTFSILGYSKEFWEKESFNVNVTEKSKINGKNRFKSYVMEYKGETLKLTIVSPDINKGEIYTFSGDEKRIYYPKLNQSVVQKIREKEISIFNVLNLLKKIEDKKTKKVDNNTFVFQKGILTEIKGKEYKIEFLDYIKSGNYNYPSKMVLSLENGTIEYKLNNFK